MSRWELGIKQIGRDATGQVLNVELLAYDPEGTHETAIDGLELAAQARTFIRAFDRCFEQRRIINTQSHDVLPVPGMICGLFAVELAFKAMIVASGGDPRKNQKNIHDLVDLFEKVPDVYRDEMLRDANLTFFQGNPAKFLEHLDPLRGMFIKLRYYFEWDSKIAIDLRFMRWVVYAVEPICIAIQDAGHARRAAGPTELNSQPPQDSQP